MTLEALELPEEPLALLRRIAPEAGRSQGEGVTGRHDAAYEPCGGIVALFAGERGTGKTLAAQALAGDLGRELLRVDLSRVISRYIGETEKNLRRVFDAAEAGGAIMFFDEADALFGRRVHAQADLSPAANIEINYLMERLDAYPGLAIVSLSTDAAVDERLRRRARYVVPFPPGT